MVIGIPCFGMSHARQLVGEWQRGQHSRCYSVTLVSLIRCDRSSVLYCGVPTAILGFLNRLAIFLCVLLVWAAYATPCVAYCSALVCSPLAMRNANRTLVPLVRLSVEIWLCSCIMYASNAPCTRLSLLPAHLLSYNRDL
eukprot:scaffold15099_cov37-Tisochrysis_lutea.AAC.7